MSPIRIAASFLFALAVVGCGPRPGPGSVDPTSAASEQHGCSDEEEDLDGFEDDDGCPDPDNDQDGIADVDDMCPDASEDADAFEDRDGCPDPDNDQDGVADTRDRCPCHAEDLNGVEDDDGCPDCAYGALRAVTLSITASVRFSRGSAELDADDAALTQLVSLLRSEPGITRLGIHGHAYDESEMEALSLRRAEAVRDHLVANGVAPSRLGLHAHADRFSTDLDGARGRVDFEVEETSLRHSESSPCGRTVASAPGCGDGEPFERPNVSAEFVLESRYE